MVFGANKICVRLLSALLAALIFKSGESARQVRAVISNVLINGVLIQLVGGCRVPSFFIFILQLTTFNYLLNTLVLHFYFGFSVKLDVGGVHTLTGLLA